MYLYLKERALSKLRKHGLQLVFSCIAEAGLATGNVPVLTPLAYPATFPMFNA